jgi:hypothetical protein
MLNTSSGFQKEKHQLQNDIDSWKVPLGANEKESWPFQKFQEYANTNQTSSMTIEEFCLSRWSTKLFFKEVETLLQEGKEDLLGTLRYGAGVQGSLFQQDFRVSSWKALKGLTGQRLASSMPHQHD